MYKITSSADKTDIMIYSLIEGGITASKLLQSLNGIDPSTPVTLHINSDGGEIFDAIALYNSLKERNMNVIIEGICASAASIVAMAGKHILMKRSSMMMIHNPITSVKGDSEALKDAASLMDKLTQSMADIYSERTGLDREQVVAIMASEAYMTPEEAVRLKFADEAEADPNPSPLTPNPSPLSPTYEDGVMAERERIKALDELVAPGREALIVKAKYQTGATARDIAIELLKAEARCISTEPQINGFGTFDRTAEALRALEDTISRKRG